MRPFLGVLFIIKVQCDPIPSNPFTWVSVTYAISAIRASKLSDSIASSMVSEEKRKNLSRAHLACRSGAAMIQLTRTAQSI
jgi:hypothetical protein